MRLVGYERMQWQNRAHFFAVSAQVMRRILVERARRHNRKRGGGVPHVSLKEAALVGGNRAADLVALDDAMHTLAQLDPRKTGPAVIQPCHGSGPARAATRSSSELPGRTSGVGSRVREYR